MVELIFRHKMNDFQVYHDENMIQQSAGIDIFRFRANKSLFFLHNDVCLADKQIPIVFLKRRWEIKPKLWQYEQNIWDKHAKCVCVVYYGSGVKRHFQQYLSYIVTVSFIGVGNQRKPPTCRKTLTNFIT
jgi:hypothetical protein